LAVVGVAVIEVERMDYLGDRKKERLVGSKARPNQPVLES
jgi:hypothetical protein